MVCSSVSYTAVLKGMRQFENNPGHICCDVKNDMVHHLLQLFFGCNEEVQTVANHCCGMSLLLLKEKAVSTNLMQRYIDENKGDELCYETGAQGDVVATMISENSWSKRLRGEPEQAAQTY